MKAHITGLTLRMLAPEYEGGRNLRHTRNSLEIVRLLSFSSEFKILIREKDRTRINYFKVTNTTTRLLIRVRTQTT